MPSYVDQLGRTVHCIDAPQRIISLVPSQTELLFDLGLDTEVAGITKFCVHPGSWFRSTARIGGPKNLHLQTIERIKPDLVIANKEENNQEEIEAIEKQFPVWISDIKNLEDALAMIRSVGMMTGKQSESESIVDRIKKGFDELSKSMKQARGPSPALYLIWRNPYMLAGSDTFIYDMMTRCGLVNAIPDLQRYPQISMEEMTTCGAEYILLASEPFPFSQKHLAELKQHLPDAKIILVDGEMFSWYGSRLLKAPVYFESLHL